uniref:NADPH:adrenodoxin oxidoreductase, mitochondrial n=1 Tax=Populus davidiana TaxID=266767 RepID=A0A6M2ERD6_9ROSI
MAIFDQAIRRLSLSLSRRRSSLSFSTLSSNPLRVCVVGTGPAGFYTAEKMLKAHQGAEVDIIDRLPTPFGLVRSGVAPDHPETKIVMNQFSKVAQHERCSFFGNVTLGSSVSLSELRELYHVVVLAYGAESDRALGIPGEYLSGIHSAREFVWWYNGHPDGKNLSPDLKSTDTAVILGQGNVALDVARILLQSTSVLATTDIASHALEALEQSSIRKVYLVGRRGPAQAACTAKELREVLGIKDLCIHINEVDLRKSPEVEEVLKNNRIHRRVHELLSKAAASAPSHPSSSQRELHFVFFRKPDRFLDSGEGSDRVAGVHFEKTMLKAVGPGKQIAVGTGSYEDLDCGLVLKSIGYKSVPVDGLPFDHEKGVVPNIKGRVLADTSGDPTPLKKGLYVCGWLKRGPTGIIATNLYCAEETVASISEDVHQGEIASASTLPKPGRQGLLQLLDNRGVRVVPFSAWEKIDSEERRLGNLRSKPREKLTTYEDLLKAATE